jgi:hypothetical protein
VQSPADILSPKFRRELRKRFHPDKWSQGQLAFDLATELMKVING